MDKNVYSLWTAKLPTTCPHSCPQLIHNSIDRHLSTLPTLRRRRRKLITSIYSFGRYSVSTWCVWTIPASRLLIFLTMSSIYRRTHGQEKVSNSSIPGSLCNGYKERRFWYFPNRLGYLPNGHHRMRSNSGRHKIVFQMALRARNRGWQS